MNKCDSLFYSHNYDHYAENVALRWLDRDVAKILNILRRKNSGQMREKIFMVITLIGWIVLWTIAGHFDALCM